MEHLDKLALFVMIGIAGAIANWMKMWIRRQIVGSLTAYLFRDHPRDTINAMFVLVGVACTAWLTGNLDTIELRPLIMNAFLAGFAVDSTINKGSPTS